MYPLFTFYMCGEPHPDIKCPGGARETCGSGYVDRTCIACNSSGLGTFEKDGECLPCPETGSDGVFVLIAVCLTVVIMGLCFLIAIKMAKINVKAFASFSIGIRYWQALVRVRVRVRHPLLAGTPSAHARTHTRTHTRTHARMHACTHACPHR